MKITQRVLHNRARACDFQWPFKNRQLATQMLDFMRRSNGIGLAAPQIGISRRLFVMETDGCERICFNPEILESAKDTVYFDEGCLSFPGDRCTIERPNSITVQYQDAAGSVIREQLTGLSSRCFQHELDHLDGITMWDRHKEQHAE